MFLGLVSMTQNSKTKQPYKSEGVGKKIRPIELFLKQMISWTSFVL